MQIALPPSAAQHRQIMPPQSPTPMSVLLCFDCPHTQRPYRVFMVAGQPYYTMVDLPRDVQALVRPDEYRSILSKGKWLDLVPEAALYGAMRLAFPEAGHPFRHWHGSIVRETIEAWRMEETA